MKQVCLFLLFLVLNLFLWTEIQTLAVNNFYNDKNFLVMKQSSAFPLQGSLESVLARSIRAGYQMNFQEYYSYQEIRSKHNEALDQMRFRFKLDPGAYLDIFYAGTPEARQGLRLSARQSMPGLIYQLGPTGQFLKSQVQDNFNLAPGWHEAVFLQKKTSLQFYCDDQLLWKTEGESLDPHFGFRSGMKKVLLSKVQTFLHQKKVWEEDFHLSSWWQRLLPKNALLLGLFMLAVLLLSAAMKDRSLVLRKSTGLVKNLFIFGLVWFSFDFFYYSRVPVGVSQWGTRSIYPSVSYLNFEALRSAFFAGWLEGIHEKAGYKYDLLAERGYKLAPMNLTFCEKGECRLLGHGEEKHLPEKKASELRILLLGGSLFQGAGVRKADETVFANVYRAMDKKLNGRRQLTALNGAIAGQHTFEQVEEFFSDYKDFQPDLIITGFMHMESDQEIGALQEFLKYTFEQHIPVVYLQRPYNPEQELKGLQLIPKTRHLIEEYAVHEVDLNKVGYDPATAKKGIIWWDGFHLTSYGNSLLADYAVPFVWEQLKDLPASGTQPHAKSLPH